MTITPGPQGGAVFTTGSISYASTLCFNDNRSNNRGDSRQCDRWLSRGSATGGVANVTASADAKGDTAARERRPTLKGRAAPHAIECLFSRTCRVKLIVCMSGRRMEIRACLASLVDPESVHAKPPG